ncbi:MAG: hypothetical protein BMS9Abin26_0989 [Gammaproteobacteria bacterium]|nr:MAG: hypothetical protein BMS9Abin26_0989 [Gammaproteobacteria bacterium]
MNKVAVARGITLVGYFGLLFLLLAWTTWISPPARAPISIMLIVLVVPLLFPLRGLLHGKRYTHGWVIFMALYYFTLGVAVTYAIPEERWLGALEILFSVMWYLGAMMYIRATRDNSQTK